ncbi:D-glucarate permease [Candidatus Burkholderia verschuerenii]|uniref:D-glucarate permease n=1 Tax=Candidatus Burkholderia verschuerenii TaxID=242163 RepID=A0A0L0MD34_9BURK|nr:D-glucarate permease [Candidatus Burkholderia verschuerenii]
MSTTSRAAHPADAIKRTRVRYVILLLIFVITTFNYADRATLSVTGTAMRAEFGFDAVRMGYIFSAFSWAYVLSQVPAGWLLDRFGVRRVYAASIFLWSLFTLLQSTIGVLGSAATAVTGLFVLRFMMGAAEAPAFPANAKVVASWFPTKERGTASAIFNSAQYFAAVVFTPLIAWLTHAFGWHHVYIVMGVAGLLLALTWLKVMKNPADHPGVNKQELEYIEEGGGLVRGHQRGARAGNATGNASANKVGWPVVKQLLNECDACRRPPDVNRQRRGWQSSSLPCHIQPPEHRSVKP